MTQRCGTCRHWQQEATYEGHPVQGYRVCNATSDYVPPIDYHNDSDDWQEPTPKPERIAFAIDGERYIFQLVTAADFGCVLHQPKEAKDERC